MIKLTAYKPKSRDDLYSMRAIAIILVVVSHFFPQYLPKGVIGVDIFFTVSGYVMGLMLLNGIAKNLLGYKEFCIKRILRIFPSLLLVLLFAIVSGYFLLKGHQYTSLGKYIGYAAVFVLNIWLDINSGVFNNNLALTKPLLHLWSLGIEMQFYLVLLLMFKLSSRYKINFLLIAMVTYVISLLAAIFMYKTNPLVAYFSLSCRLWEFMLGVILAYVIVNWVSILDKYSNLRSFLGCSLLGMGLIMFGEEKLSVGYLELVACIGSVLLISASESWINRVILSNKVLVFIGVISYPIYLWHWLLLSLANIAQDKYLIKIDCLSKVELITVSLLFAWLTHIFIEQPLRMNKPYAGLLALLLIAGMLFIAILGFIIGYVR